MREFPLQYEISAMNPLGILDSLRAYSFIAPYSLAVCSNREGIIARSLVNGQLCGICGMTATCGTCCTLPLEDALREALTRNAPIICRCPIGLLGFAIRLPEPAPAHRCLIAWGVRTSSINLFYLESMSRKGAIRPFAILDRLADMPIVELKDVCDAADRVFRILPTLLTSNLHNQLLEHTVSRLNSVVGISAQLDRGKTIDEVVSLLSESLGILFDCARIAVAIAGQESGVFVVRGTWGLPADLGQISGEVLQRLIAEHPGERSLQLAPGAGEFVRGLDAATATFLPLMAGTEFLGCVLLPDTELQPRDALLAEILTGRAASRMLQLKNEASHYADSSLPAKLLAMTSAMQAIENPAELYSRILSTAADFLGAAKGSLMLLDEAGTALKIVASLGLNEQISKSLSIKLGEGIAGKVAASGAPIVVNDIESDSRVATTNRPRYRTKSFISTPFRHEGRVMGVLNLSDKPGNEIFTETDLQLLSLLLGQAVMVLERAESKRRTELLSSCAVVDPATNLYNRSFLDKRLTEEVNRSYRQGLLFTLVMVEVGHLNLYRTICGTNAGITATRKTVAAILRSARQMDVVCSFSADTFCIILPGTSKNDALAVANRINKACLRMKISGADLLPSGKFSASIGLAAYPDDGENPAVLLESAQEAVSKARIDGSDYIVLQDAVADSLKDPLALFDDQKKDRHGT
jgi:diguanylate cyclase (GGDEF)-like protein